MKRIYVAGPYSANNVMDVLHNIRKGIRMSYIIFAEGYAPFSPWLDFHYVLMDNPERLTVKNFYEYSLAWLEVSDAVFVLPDFENSKGTLAEIERAKELNIPIVYSLDELFEKIPA